ncbi:DUF397 domain-containing protein [Streptomyces sp. B8F3]|uniref:DUF397 domain-containing protein n=1 Tax=unclassified Streptomyces TaxID=2593676 RepID=UPI00325DB97F
MTNTDTSPVRRHKSSHSSTDGSECVEVGDGLPVVPVRDSKHPHGPVLVFSTAGWTDFMAALNRGELFA